MDSASPRHSKTAPLRRATTAWALGTALSIGFGLVACSNSDQPTPNQTSAPSAPSAPSAAPSATDNVDRSPAPTGSASHSRSETPKLPSDTSDFGFDMYTHKKAGEMPSAATAVRGTSTKMQVSDRHFVLGSRTVEPFPAGLEKAMFGLGCFWGAEKNFWKIPGVYSTSVGYAGGFTENATYEQVCSGRTGHAEVVLVVFDPKKVSYAELLKSFWEAHDPTQGMRQGNDVGTQYRSGVYTFGDAQKKAAEASRAAYQKALTANGYNTITTEIVDAPPFYYAEDYHQQYLAKNPNGYCGHGGTGVSCPTGLGLGQ